jgi:3-methyladenine DNA glycosylase AlkD
LSRRILIKDKMRATDVINKLKANANPTNVLGMAKFGISAKNTLGVSMPFLRNTAKEIGRDHDLALALWDSGIHEARILASLVDDPTLVSESQMEKWVADFDSWDVCDQCCSNLFDKANLAYVKALEWSNKKEEYVKRAGFVLMATLSVHDKESANEKFMNFLPIIARESLDDRNYVKKAVNKAAKETAKEISGFDSPAAKWIASDALRELRSVSFRKGKRVTGKKAKKKKK